MFGWLARQHRGRPERPRTRSLVWALLIVLIEDIAAVRNLGEILKVDHINIFFAAPNDLATSMGHIGTPPAGPLKRGALCANRESLRRTIGWTEPAIG